MVINTTISNYFNTYMGLFDQRMVIETKKPFEGHRDNNVYTLKWIFKFP